MTEKAGEKLSTIDFGKVIGISRQKILEACKNGRLSKSISQDDSGVYKIDSVEGILEWFANGDPTRAHDGKLSNQSLLKKSHQEEQKNKDRRF